MEFKVTDRCNGCLACVENCPASALRVEDTCSRRSIFHNPARCARCGQCWRICPQKAIEFDRLLSGEWLPVVTLDLRRCQLCGEPIFTEAYAETLKKAIGNSNAPLCPRHRQRQAAASWPKTARVKVKSGGHGARRAAPARPKTGPERGSRYDRR